MICVVDDLQIIGYTSPTMKRHCLIVLVGVLAALSSFALDIEFTLWRGESYSTILPDSCVDIREPGPETGIALRRGVMRPVQWCVGHNCPGSRKQLVHETEYRVSADRCEYGSKAKGRKFCTIDVSAGAKPGDYDFGMLKVKVLDKVLPPARDRRYFLNIWQHPWAVARVNGVKPFSPEHYKAMEPLWRMLAAAGGRTLTVTLTDGPWNHQCFDRFGSMIGRKRAADGAWRFDYSLFDEYVAFGRKCGFDRGIECYSLCPWGYKVDYVDAMGKTVVCEAKPGTPFFAEYWGDFLVDFERHLAEKGWLDDTYLALDEREPDDIRHVMALIRQKAPRFKTSACCWKEPKDTLAFEPDVFTELIDHTALGLRQAAGRRRKEGKRTLTYVATGPRRPQLWLWSEPGEAFTIGFYPATANLDGLLFWAWNMWGEDGMNDITYNEWQPGECFLVYPDGSPSYRFLELCNGIVAAEKFWILRNEGGRETEVDYLLQQFELKKLVDETDLSVNFHNLRKAVMDFVNLKQ